MKPRIRYWILMVLVVSLLAGCALPGGNSQALAQALERAMAQSPAETAPAETEPPATAAPERVLPGKRTFSQMEYVRPDLDALEDSRLTSHVALVDADAPGQTILGNTRIFTDHRQIAGVAGLQPHGSQPVGAVLGAAAGDFSDIPDDL